VTRLTSFEAEWRRFFETAGVEPLEVVYEDFVESYEATIFAILRYLEMPFPEDMRLAPPRLLKQSDELSEEFVRRYREIKSRPRREPGRVDLSYLICATPRTGSSLLIEALESTGVAGKPKEYFDPTFEDHWKRDLGITSDRDYFPRILAGGSTPNGVFGAKVQWHQFSHLIAKLRLVRAGASTEHELLKGEFPDLRYVFLTRRDKVRQAVSYYRAITTGIWWSIRPEANAPQPPAPVTSSLVVPIFDFAQIDRWVRHFTDFESNWRFLFEEAGVKPFVVTYEDFVDNYESTVLAILGYLGIPISEGLKVTPPRLQKMADETTEHWVRRYRKLKRS
jgi:trehalose 2-sulfotransferase